LFAPTADVRTSNAALDGVQIVGFLSRQQKLLRFS